MTDTIDSPSNRAALERIHGALTKVFMQYLENTPKDKVRASMVAEIRGFLRDNNATKDLMSFEDQRSSLATLQNLEVPFQ